MGLEVIVDLFIRDLQFFGDRVGVDTGEELGFLQFYLETDAIRQVL